MILTSASARGVFVEAKGEGNGRPPDERYAFGLVPFDQKRRLYIFGNTMIVANATNHVHQDVQLRGNSLIDAGGNQKP